MKKVFNRIVYWFVERKILRQRMAVRDSIDQKCQQELDEYKRLLIEASVKINKQAEEIKVLKFKASKLTIKLAFKENSAS